MSPSTKNMNCSIFSLFKTYYLVNVGVIDKSPGESLTVLHLLFPDYHSQWYFETFRSDHGTIHPTGKIRGVASIRMHSSHKTSPKKCRICGIELYFFDFQVLCIKMLKSYSKVLIMKNPGITRFLEFRETFLKVQVFLARQPDTSTLFRNIFGSPWEHIILV